MGFHISHPHPRGEGVCVMIKLTKLGRPHEFYSIHQFGMESGGWGVKESGSFSDIFYGSPQTATGDFEREQTFLMKKG